MKKLLINATGLMVIAMGGSASADVIYSNFLNTNIATNYTGTDVIVGGGTLNLFFGGAGVANDSVFQPFRIASGGLGTMKSFALGDTINSGAGFIAIGSGGSTDHLGSQFTAGSEAYLGFQLSATNNGWMRGTFTYATSGAVIKDWAYDNSGSAIKAGLIKTDITGAGLTTTTLDVGSSDSFALASALTNGVAGGYTNSVLKLGDGTVTLKGTNTYTGATNVSAGTLYLTGALSNSSVTVDIDGTIGSNGATGILGSGLTIDAGGSLDLTGATLLANADSTGILSITGGSLTLGELTFQNIIGWDWLNAAPGTYELIDGSFSVNFGATEYISEETAYVFANGLSKGYFTSGSLNAVIVAIPEPSTAFLGSLGALMLLRRRRR